MLITLGCDASPLLIGIIKLNLDCSCAVILCIIAGSSPYSVKQLKAAVAVIWSYRNALD